jgi:hypothetical protein
VGSPPVSQPLLNFGKLLGRKLARDQVALLRNWFAPRPVDADHAMAVIRQRCGSEIVDAVVPVDIVKVMFTVADELAQRIAAIQARQDELDRASEVEAPVPV